MLFYSIAKPNSVVSVTATFASTVDTKSNTFGEQIFLNTTNSIVAFISALFISYLKLKIID